MLGKLALLVGPGIIAAVLSSPLFLSGRFRSLFTRFPPVRSTIASYLFVTVALSMPFVIGTGIILTTTSTDGAALSNALLNMAFVVTIGYVVVLPVAASVGLPRVGIDWDPTNYGLGTWLLLVGAALWYSAVFVVPLAFFALVLALPTG